MASVGKEIHVVRARARSAGSLAENRALGGRIGIEALPTDAFQGKVRTTDSENGRVRNRGKFQNGRATLIGSRSVYQRTGIVSVQESVAVEIRICRNGNDEFGDGAAALGISDYEGYRIRPLGRIRMLRIGHGGNGTVSEIPTIGIRSLTPGNLRGKNYRNSGRNGERIRGCRNREGLVGIRYFRVRRGDFSVR